MKFVFSNITWWDRFRLLFVKKRYHVTLCTVVEYKVMKDCYYIIAMYRTPPKHINCRCSTNPSEL